MVLINRGMRKSLVAAIAALLALVAVNIEPAAAESIPARRDALRQKYIALLHERADELAAGSQAASAQAVRRWAVRERKGRNYLYVPQAAGERPGIFQKDEALRNLQRFYAEHLFDLARDALKADRQAQAYQLAHEVLRADPRHELARAVVNFDEAQPIRARKKGGRWEVETEHFEIATTHSPEAAKEVGRRLEELHAVWRQLFADYWFTEAELQRRFDGKASRLVEPDHQIMLFPDKAQYVEYLKQDEPGIAVSSGYYAERTRTAYFYADERTLTTQFHEATHQLFHERQRRGRAAGIDANFWVVEGVATYMESLQKGDGYFVVGGPGAYRLQFARYRALTEEFYVPLSELVAMGRPEMKAAGDDLSRLYSQSAGLAHFFMDGAGGKYRDAFVQYLDAVYRDKADAATLARLTGHRYEQLDEEYLDFLRVGNEDLAGLIPGEHVPRLYLSRTNITDAAMEHIAGVRGLQRLHVGHCRITDAGLRQLPARDSLEELNLEQTAITDASLPHVAKMTQLRSLDLSGCRISDEGLQSLADLQQLEILWLTDTPVTDAGLKTLHGMKRLKFVDVAGTRVTAEGWAELKRAVPSISERR